MKTILTVLTLIISSTTLFATEIDPLWEKRTAAIIKFQTKGTNLLVSEYPELEEIAVLQHDLQLTLIQMRNEKYYYLLKNKPDNLIRNQGISRWANFKWTDEDENILTATSGKYLELKDKKEQLKEKEKNYSMTIEVREKFSELFKIKEYQKLQQKLMDTMKDIDILLE